MADDQANTVLASWSTDGDNNVMGLYTGPSTLEAVSDLPATMLPHVADPLSTCRISPWYDSLIGTLFDPSGALPLTNPGLSVLSTVADPSHLVTIDWSTALNSNLDNADVFFDVAFAPGLKLRFAGPTGVDLSVAAMFQDTYSVPSGLDFSGKEVSVVVVQSGSDEEFSSGGFVMAGANFDNTVTPAAPPPTLTGPTISSVVADVAKEVTLIGSAGPGTLGVSRVSAEVVLGGGQVYVFEDPVTIDLSLAQPITLVFTIPNGLNFDGKNVALVARGTGSNEGFKFESTPALMSGSNFNNSDAVLDPVFLNPSAQILNVDIGIDSIALLEAEAGPTDSPFVTVRWEADLVPGEIKVILAESRNELMGTRRMFSDSVSIPPTLNLQNSDMRFVVVPQTGLVAEV